MTSHIAVVVIAVLAIGFAADTFFRLFLVREETSRLLNNVSSVARQVVVSDVSGAFVIRSERSIFVNTLQLAGIEVYEFPTIALDNTPFKPEEINRLQQDRQLFRKINKGLFTLPELELFLVDGEHHRLILLKNRMTHASETLANMRRTILYSGLIAVVLTVLVSYGTARYMVAPIRKIQQVARKVVQGDFRQRVNLKAATDEFQELALTFNRAVDRVEETMREQKQLDQLRQQFVSDVSHEFRIPLTSLGGFLELLQQNKIPAADRHRVIGMMQKDVDRLTRLVHDLLDLSRLQEGKIQLVREPVQLQETIADVVDRLIRQIEAKQLQFKVKTAPSLTVWADEDRLQQILLNLIGNAVQHTPPRESVRIYTERTTEKKSVTVVIENSGTTIPPDVLPRLWDRFTKVDKSRSQRGTGLGLAIARELVRLHGGDIWAENLPDRKGVRFAFTLPLNQ